jgi:hypothetical protein
VSDANASLDATAASSPAVDYIRSSASRRNPFGAFLCLESAVNGSAPLPGGFNIGSVLLRTGWTGDSARHVLESPVLRLTQPPFNYRLTFSDGIRGLSVTAREELEDWRRFLADQQDALGSPSQAVIAIYRYYDVNDQAPQTPAVCLHADAAACCCPGLRGGWAAVAPQSL